MSKRIELNSDLRQEYTQLFNTCEIKEEHKTTVKRLIDRILANKGRYTSLQAVTDVPWFVIAGIHCMETGLRFDRHLHNGDSLHAKTRHVPRNRPPGTPPFTWEQSAIDALKYDNMTGWKDWSLPGTLYKMEGYNGWGYRKFHSTVLTPYLWSFSNHYTEGKYAADGKFDPNLVSRQAGVATLLKSLEQHGEIRFDEKGEQERAEKEAVPAYPGHVIMHGEMNSHIVSIIQNRLNGLGCASPLLDIDGDYGRLTEAAVRMFQARSEDHTGEPLDIDGKVGPLTWEQLFGGESLPRMKEPLSETPLLKKVIDVARSEIGVTEDPPGSNRGTKVEAYLASVGLGGGHPWCAAFVYWCFEQAAKELGIDNPCIKTAGVLDHWSSARKQGIRCITHIQASHDPLMVQPGMIFVIDTGDPGGAGHTGLVERVDGGKLVTIEGNTNNKGGREGIGVFRRNKRKVAGINKGFIDYSRGLG
jgi:lysozyme family protein